MKILAIYKHYWPDTTPYARLLRAMLEQFVADGHRASVLTAQPSYNNNQQPLQPAREELGGVEVYRFWLPPERKERPILRAINFCWFLLRSILFVCWNRNYDVIISNSHPPVFMGWALRIIQRLTGIPYIFHCQDIHPECSQIAGKIKPGLFYNVLRAIDRKNGEQAWRVVTLSADMVQTLKDRAYFTGLDQARSNSHLEIINNFPLTLFSEAPVALPELFQQKQTDDFFVFFAGNLGAFQNLDLLVDAAWALQDRPQIKFVFMGSGAAKSSLITQAGSLLNRTVYFIDQQPVEVAVAAMKQADLGVVSLLPDVYRVAYPSKSMMYLSAGCPLLAIIEETSELACEIRNRELGYVACEREPAAVAQAISQAVAERGLWTLTKRDQLEQACEQLFGEKAILNRWSLLLNQLSEEKSGKAIEPVFDQSESAAA